MAARVPWIVRRWRFGGPVGLYPDLLERLRGTPARLEEAVAELSRDVLTRRKRDGTWSIQENAGHLLDLEHLPSDRLEDFLAGAETLRAADISNRATHAARHHDRPIDDILAAFRQARSNLLRRLDGLSEADFARTAIHPRLEVPMRLVDMCQFQADHDDYHLARIRELIRLFVPASEQSRA